MFMGHSVCKSLHIWIQSEESPTFSYAHFLSYRLRAGAKNSLKRLLCNWQALRATSFSRGRTVASGARLCVRNVIKSRFQNKTGAYRNFFFFIQKLLNFEANLTVWAVWALRQQSCQKRKEKKRGVKNRDHCYVKRYDTLRKKQLYTVQGAECTVPTCWGRGCPAWTASSCEGWRRGGGGGEQGYVPVQVAYMKAMIVISTEINSKV